ncbi:MAG: Na/Pi cotransporter family protein, partial [Clostridia bacterium]|nr:Na/Pi cotransporter family protein [Clostridia bacterium]
MVEPLEQVVDDLKEQIKHNHTIRLQKSQCSIELGFILSDILTNLERVADHCSNVAGCLIEMSKHESLDLHSYLHNVKETDKQYALYYEAYAHKYAIQIAK